ncbi:MAG: response regulator transcription factor [Peptococcaceae bacterium]|nr:response regulator transcription factor [Peptococcaceae bacterium]
MIYCVEDDQSIRELIMYALNSSGFDVRGFADGESFWQGLAAEAPELVLLDVMLPGGEDGISILKRLRSEPKTRQLPVLMLTAKGSEYDKVLGLDSGADDYVTKPFGVMELISRVKALLRRSDRGKPVLRELTAGNLVLNEEKHQVWVEDREVQLTLKEFELLHYLLENQDLALSRNKILEAVWGFDFEGETRTVDMHIKTLRQKLGSDGKLIQTVRGIGYKLGKEKT